MRRLKKRKLKRKNYYTITDGKASDLLINIQIYENKPDKPILNH